MKRNFLPRIFTSTEAQPLSIATWFPDYIRRESAGIKLERIDDSKNLLESDPFATMKDRPSFGR